MLASSNRPPILVRRRLSALWRRAARQRALRPLLLALCLLALSSSLLALTSPRFREASRAALSHVPVARRFVSRTARAAPAGRTVSAPAPFAAVYTWNTGSSTFNTASNWTPSRTSPATDDILVFNTSGPITVTNVTTQTIGQLSVGGGALVTLQAGLATQTLTISGGAGALAVASGSQLNIGGDNVLTISVAAGSTGSISGSMTFSGATAANPAHQLLAASASGITFNNGSSFTQGIFNTGNNVFGSGGTPNTVVFASGSTFVQKTGNTPFPKSQFQTGSLFSLQQNSTPSFSGRTYANFELNSSGANVTVTGGSAVSIDNLTVTQGTLNFNMTATPGHAIKGNISVASGATLNFNPATAGTVNLSGTSGQTISGAGTITTSALSTIAINNSNGVTLNTPMTLNGTLALTSGAFTNGSNLTLGNGATITRQSGSALSATPTFGTTVNVTYTGSIGIATGPELPAATTVLNNLTVSMTGATNSLIPVSLQSAITVNGSFQLIGSSSNSAEFDANQPIVFKGDYSNTNGNYAGGTTSFSGTSNWSANTANNAFGSVTITSGASVNGGFMLARVSGWQDNASVGGASGMTGGVVQFISTASIGGTVTTPNFGKIAIAANAGTVTPAKAFSTGNFELDSGTFNDGGFTHTVSGAWDKVGGTYTASGTISFIGPNTSTIGASNFNNLTINKDTGATQILLTGDLTIAGNWTNTQGTVNANGKTVTFSGNGNTQTISGNNTFANLTINHTNAGGVTAAGSTLAVTGLFHLVSGKFTSATQYHDVQIDNGGTLALSGPISVDGNWTTNSGGVFTPGSNGVSFNGPTGQTITGNTSFYDLTKSVAAAQTFNFTAGSLTTVTHSLTLTGATGQLLSLRSTSTPTLWKLHAPATQTVDYLNVKDSDASGGNAVAPAHSTDAGNNINWTFGNTISGTIIANHGNGSLLTGKTITLLKNGTSVGTTTTDGSGVYTFSGVTLASGDKIAVYITSPSTERGATVTLSGTSDITNLNIFQDSLIVRSDSGGSMANSDLGSASDGSGDLMSVYTVPAGALTTGAGTEILIWNATAFAPGNNIFDGGDWTNKGAFTAGANTVTFNGTTNQTIGGLNDSFFNNLTISNTGTSPTNVVSLALNTSVGGTLSVSGGVFSQGASGSDDFSLAANAVSVAANTTWQNLGKGDLTLSGNVGNSGTINFNSNGSGCNDAKDILIRSVGNVQRTWSGTGTFSMTDVDVDYQKVPGGIGNLPLQIIVNSGVDGGHNSGWTFTNACAGPFTWIGGANQDWTIPTNWSPVRPTAGQTATPTTDELIFDGNVTPGPTVISVPAQTIAALRFIHANSFTGPVTLNASGANTLTINGGSGNDLDIPAGGVLSLAGTNALTISVAGAGHEATIAGEIIFQDGAHRLLGTNADEIEFAGANAFATASNYSPSTYPFGTGTDGSVMFQSGATGTFNAGLDPFGGNTHSVAQFNIGSTASFSALSAFSPVARTYGFLQLGGNQLYAASGNSPISVINDLTIDIGSKLTLSSTAGGNLILDGNLTDNGSFNTNGRTVSFGGLGTQTINSAGSETFDFMEIGNCNILLNANLSVLGGAGQDTINFQIASASTLTLNGKTLTLGGEFGTFSPPAAGSGLIPDTAASLALNNGGGSGDMGTVPFATSASANPLGNLTVARTGVGANATFGASRTITNALTLTSGTLTMAGSNTLTISPGITSIGRTSGYVIGNLQKSFGAFGNLGAFTLPVGTANAYSPMDANVTANSNGTLTVQAVQGKQPNISGTNALQRYWTLAGSGLTTDLTLHYRGGAPAAGDVNGNEALYKIFKYNGSFTQPPNQSVNTSAHTATVLGVNSFSDWTLAEPTAVNGCPTGFTVNDNGDAPDANPGDGLCATGGGQCTLRAAIEEANALTACGPIDINFSIGSNAITLTNGQLTVDHNVNVNGPTLSSVVVSGNNASRGFTVNSGKTVAISNLTISAGNAFGSNGGGVLNNGTLTLTNSTVSGNTGTNSGGGIANINGTLTLINSTVSGNTANAGSAIGGGIFNLGGTLTLTNTTVSGNTANGGSSNMGGGVYAFSGTVNLRNTIIAGNSASGSGPDISGTFAGQGNNLIGKSDGGTGFINGVNGDIVGTVASPVDPLLGGLMNNGGPTFTQGLLYNSPAIDAGNDCVFTNTCSPSLGAALTLDQRGLSRQANGDLVAGAHVDIGAYERQATESRTVPPGSNVHADLNDVRLAFPTVTVTRPDDGAANGGQPTTVNRSVSITVIPVPGDAPPGSGPAFDVTPSTNFYAAPVDVCFYLPSVTPKATFDTLKILHRESGVLADHGSYVNFASRIVCTEVTSFSDFVITHGVSPSVTNGTIDGTITDSSGVPLAGTTINLSGTQNRETITDAQGRYSFDSVETNGFYTVTPTRANYGFSPLNRSFSALGVHTEAAFVASANDDHANAIDTTEFFVRQQYLDFLGREPDPPGFNGWVNTLRNCAAGDTSCDRVHVSEAFFRSAEFQERGYFVYRFYSSAFGRKPDYAEFTPDLRRVSGFLTNDQLEAAKTALVNDFMARPAFAAQYSSLSNSAYVDALINTAAVNLSNRQAMVDGLNAGTLTRAQVFRQITESAEVYQKYYNQAFVVMEYFGYLRRDPDALYTNWIQVLDANPADSRHMVEGFVTSTEYRNRFAQ
jgi:CSLREA domain-containing protein